MISPSNSAAVHTGAASGQITIALDGQPRRLPAGTTLAALVEQLGHAPERAGTAVNGDFVARGQRAARVLAEGDAVLLFQPIVGG
jgi:sulfur carrier protein